MDFNPEASTKSTFIGEGSPDPTRSTFGKSSTFVLQGQDASPLRQDMNASSSFDSEKKSFDNNSFTINQEESSPNLKKLEINEPKMISMTESDKYETLLKKRLSSIAEMRESDSYHDYLKSIKDRIIEEKTVFENSKEYISERNSIAENDNFIPTRFTPPKTPPKKHPLENSLNKSNPVITSDTQIELYKSLNLDQSSSGTNILKELESRKNLQNRQGTMSFNLEKNTLIQTNTKKITLDDNIQDKKTSGIKYKTHKTFQNLNYSANVTSIIKDDPLKRIDMEYEEEDMINEKSFVDSILATTIPMKSFSSEKLSNFCPIRAKNLQIFKEICSVSKANFTCLYSNEEYIAGGTDKGVITVIEHRKTTIGAFIILGNNSELKNKGQITCLDIGYQNKLLVAGYSSGTIAVFNLQKSKLVKKTKAVFKNEKVKQVKFLHSDESKKKGIVVIACNEDKIMKLFIYKSNNFGRKKLKKQISPIICKTGGPLIQINPIPIESEDKNQKRIPNLICSTPNRVFLQNLESNTCDFELEKPNILNAKAWPFVICDKTDLPTYQGNPIKARFIVAWGVFIFMVGCMKPKENSKEGAWRIYKFQVIDTELIFATICSSQIIFGINFEKKVFLIHFEELVEGDLKKIDLGNPLNINSHSIKNLQGPLNEFFLHLVKNNIDFTQRSLISYDFHHSSMYFLVGAEIFCLNLISWEKNIQSYIMEEEYTCAMSNMVQIYRNKIKYLGGIPSNLPTRKKNLSNSIQEISVAFFLQSIKRNQDMLNECSYVKEFAQTIEFLIETDHFEFLFNNIMKDLELRGYLRQFTYSLEPFILKKKIKVVPELALTTLLDILIKENQNRLADKLIVHLDLKIMDYSSLISVCLENHLFKGLTHLCSEGDDNFMIPIIKILSVSMHKSANLKLSFEDMQDLKYRCLWYIQMCLKGHLITGELMQLEKWKKAIRQVVDWIINQENFNNFLKLDTDVAFKLLFMLFKGYPYQVVKKSADYFNFKPIYKEANETIFFCNTGKKKNSQISQEIIKLKRSGDKIFNDPLNYMIEFIITYEKSFGIENPFYAEHKRFAFFAFIIQLYHQAGDYNIDHRIGYFCLQYFMENPDKLDLDQIYESDAARFLMRDELEIKKSECLMQIMRFLPDGAEANPYIDKLLASHSTLYGVTLFLYMKKQNYQACFDLFIKTKNPLFKNKVFDWLFNTIAKLEMLEEDGAKVLKQNILNKSAELVSVNSYKAHKLFQKYTPSEEKNVIISLIKYPKLGIEYMHHLIKAHAKEPNFSLGEDLGVIYADLLVKENKLKRLNEEIKNKTISFDIAKEILTKSNILDKFSHFQENHAHQKE